MNIKKILKSALCAVVAVSMIISAMATGFAEEQKNRITFTDVDANTPEGEAIYKLVNNNILDGNGDGTFTPNGDLTRAELCKMINLVFNYTEKSDEPFSDVTDKDWFKDYVAVARKAGYIQGYEDGSFRGNNNITREEFCAILTRVNTLYDLGIKANISDEVSGWARGYVDMVVISGLMRLEENNTFRATENMKRHEIAVVLARFVNDKAQEPQKDDDKKDETTNKGNSTAVGNNGSSTGSKPSGSTGGSTGNDESDDFGGTYEPETPNEPDKNYEEINAEIVAKIADINTQIKGITLADFDENSWYANDEEKQIMKDIMDDISVTMAKTIEDAKTTEITEDYVSTVYKADVDEVKAMYYGMSEDAQGDFRATVAMKLELDVFNFLYNYFFNKTI